MSSPASMRLSPELRASLFHFTVFTTSGAASAYFSVWMADKGISPGQIGIVNAAPVLALLVINLFVGRLADRASDWRQMIILLALVAGVVPVGLFFASGFVGILVVWTLISIPVGSMAPVVDAATLRMTERRGTSFGSIRGWGTLGSMVSSAGTGLVVALFGAAGFVPTLLAFSLARAGLSLQLPRFRAPERALTLAPQRAVRLREVLKPWFVLPLVAFALVQATHAILIGFAALVWKQQGLSEGVIGPLIATGTASEAVIMFLWRRVGARVGARQMILAATLATVVRWGVIALAPPLPVLFLMQALHSVTFAVGYLGIVHFIANWTGEEIAAEAQGFAFVLQQAATVVGLVAFGWLVAPFGAAAFFAAALLGVVAAACVLVSLRLRPPHQTALTAAG
jgi:MFS transporter, PPP family, 3-phenylpropionic acid transporter